MGVALFFLSTDLLPISLSLMNQEKVSAFSLADH